MCVLLVETDNDDELVRTVRTRHHCMFQQVIHTCFKIIKNSIDFASTTANGSYGNC